jgi:hypothetical protein
MADLIQCLEQRLGELPGAFPVALQEVKRHPLRGLGADTRQAAQGPHQLGQGAGLLHEALLL